MAENQIDGIPVADGTRKLVGIVTNRDLRFEKQMSKPVAEIMTDENLITATAGMDLMKGEGI